MEWLEDMLPYILGVYFGFGAVCGLVASFIAGTKGYKKTDWFFVGLLINVLAIAAVGFASDVSVNSKKMQQDIADIAKYVRSLNGGQQTK
ncbi:MAG: hypothetical protein ACFNX1_00725 [Treponema lecithinolyticum]|uniref:hypothetical protein n=1 Tax=Treponema lecithinolyticum TaxID=53418 RepID=UPI00361FFFE0